MPSLIFGHTEKLAAWASQQIPQMRGMSFGPCQAIGVASGPNEDDELYAVVVFHDYQPACRSIQLSAAARSPKWMTKGVARAVLFYPFMQLNCFRVWGATPHTNLRAIRLNRGLGFKVDGTLRHAFGPGVHAVMVSMTRPEYLKSRWAPLPIPRTQAQGTMDKEAA